MRPVHPLSWSRVLLLLALPGCLVSFNDYPLGDPKAEPESNAGTDAGGNVSVLPNAGTDAGGSVTSGGSAAASGGVATGATAAVAGSAATGSGAEAGATDVDPLVTNDLLVDDFEDGDATILERQGRSGSWYVANDGRGMQTPRAGVPLVPTPLMPVRGESSRGAHTFGGPFATWGALIGTTLAASGDSGVAYDLTDYRGVRFWVRSGSPAPGAAKKVRFNVRTPATIMGGGCTVCGDHFGVDVPLTAQWEQVDVSFSTLKQTGYGRPVLPTPDLAHSMGIELLFTANVMFDLWIDDIELY